MTITHEQLQHLNRLASENAERQWRDHLSREETLLLEKLPEWKDQEVAKREIAAIKRHLVDHEGYTEDEVQMIPSHKNLLAARKLMLNHQREEEEKRRASEERSKREREKKVADDKAAEQRKLLNETKKRVRSKYGDTHAQAEALADAFGVNNK